MTNEILKTFLEANGLKELTNAAGRALGCPLLVIDDSFHVAAYFRADSINDPYGGVIRHGELSYDESALISASAASGELLHSPAGYHYRISQLNCGELRMGYTLCIMPENALPSGSDEDFALINSFLAKQLYYERHRGGITATAEEVLSSLIDGRFQSEEFFELQANTTFLGSFRPERFVLMKPMEQLDGLKTDMLRDRLRRGFHASDPFPYRDCVIMFLHGEHDREAVGRAAEEYDLYAVISEPLQSLYALGRGYGRVRRLLDYLIKKSNGKAFAAEESRYSALMMLKTLAGEGYCLTDEVDRLYKYDLQNDSEYCLTLYTYLMCSRSLKDTCEKLFTHRNTVLYRIRRIREDFAIDTDGTEDRMRLILSLGLALVMQGRDELFIKEMPSKREIDG